MKPARDYFQEQMPKAGYELGEGDAEEAEAETNFSGHGLEGHLKLRSIEGCNGASSLDIVTRA